MDFLGDYAWYVITALIVLVALALIYVMTRSLGARIKGRRGQRLGISEYHEIDKMRRLVLVLLVSLCSVLARLATRRLEGMQSR